MNQTNTQNAAARRSAPRGAWPGIGAPALVAVVAIAVLAPGRGFAQTAGAAPPASAESPQLSIELIDPKVFRSCSDPHDMPFSTQNGEGFENKIAKLFADKLDKSLDYTWYPNSVGFVRNTLGSYKCDVIMSMPQGNTLVQVTNPYYRTAYTLVAKKGSDLDGVDTLEDTRLAGKRIGIVAGTPPSNIMTKAGLMARARPYPLVIDTRIDSSAVAMIDDLVKGEIDAGVLWGPMAGYYAKSASVPLSVTPLVKEKTGPPLIYYMGMGVRPSDQEWKRVLNRLIKENEPEIQRIIASFGVPLLDAHNRPLSEGNPPKPQ